MVMGCCNCSNEADENEEAKSFLLIQRWDIGIDTVILPKMVKERKEREYLVVSANFQHSVKCVLLQTTKTWGGEFLRKGPTVSMKVISFAADVA